MYLGFVVARDGISPDLQKVEAVRSFPQPHDVKTLRSFLGLASYYRRFIHRFSVVANPLFALTRKEVEFEWSVACEEAFEKLKKLLTEAPVLAFPNFAEGFLLDTDASGERCWPRSSVMARCARWRMQATTRTELWGDRAGGFGSSVGG